MLQDNHAEYARYKTRRIPRPGQALRPGLVYCGAWGHKMVVQYKGGTESLCNYLRQQYRVPVCQYVPADPVEARGVEAFFAALSPVALDVYTHTLATQRQQAEGLDAAQRQQLERLRYDAALCERQGRRVDPAHRLVAAELERRWAAAWRKLQAAEAVYAQRGHAAEPPLPLAPEVRAALLALGASSPSSGPPTYCPSNSAKRCCAVCWTKWSSSESAATRCPPALCGGVARQPPWRSPSP
jgi:hypothetical protein